MNPIRYRKKPVVIEAMEFKDWATASEIFDWSGCAFYVPEGFNHSLRRENEYDLFAGHGHIKAKAEPFLVIHTLEGAHRADLGDYIIRGVQGEFYPCKPDIFAETYEVAE